MAIMQTTIVGPISGSLGAVTFSRNRGGKYVRVRATPTNPNSPAQQTVRSAMSTLSARWSGVLTQVQRDAWDLYALNVPLPNALGEPVNVGGIGMYQRTNVLVLQTDGGGGVIIDDAPSIFNLGEYTEPDIANVSDATDQISLDFTPADAWANEAGSNMLVYTGRPQNPGINYFKGPYRFAGSIDGDDILPPTSPAAIPLAFPAVEGQKIFARVRVIRSDGRVSATFRDGEVVTS